MNSNDQDTGKVLRPWSTPTIERISMKDAQLGGRTSGDATPGAHSVA